MQKSILLILFVSLSATLSAQKTDPSSMTKADYLAKAKRQNSTAWVLVGGGGVMTTIGLVVASNNALDELASAFSEEKNDGGFVTGVVLTITGVAMMGGSVPLFIASSRNRRMGAAMTASFKVQETYLPFYDTGSGKSFPALSLKLRW